MMEEGGISLIHMHDVSVNHESHSRILPIVYKSFHTLIKSCDFDLCKRYLLKSYIIITEIVQLAGPTTLEVSMLLLDQALFGPCTKPIRRLSS